MADELRKPPRAGPLEAKREPPVEAEGSTPLALILSLLKSALELPTLARTFTKGFLPRK